MSNAQVAIRGDATKSPINSPDDALPRTRTSGTASKKPLYSGDFSGATPRGGRRRERSNDRTPSGVLTGAAQDPSPSSSRGERARRLADRHVVVAPVVQAAGETLLVGVDHAPLGGMVRSIR